MGKQKYISSLLLILATLSPIQSRGDIFYECDHGAAHIINKLSEGNGPDEKPSVLIKGYKNIGSGIDWVNYNKKGFISEETGARFYCGGAVIEFWPHINTGNIEGQCGAWQGESIKIRSWEKLTIKTPEIYMDHCNSSFYIKRLTINPDAGYVSLVSNDASHKKEHGPSFSCKNIHGLASLLICASPELSKIDFLLNKNYQQMIRGISEQQRKPIVAHQVAWIAKKQHCTSYSCLCKVYKGDAGYINELLKPNGIKEKESYGSLFGGMYSEYSYGGCS